MLRKNGKKTKRKRQPVDAGAIPTVGWKLRVCMTERQIETRKWPQAELRDPHWNVQPVIMANEDDRLVVVKGKIDARREVVRSRRVLGGGSGPAVTVRVIQGYTNAATPPPRLAISSSKVKVAVRWLIGR